ncbi:hypothetical protein KCP73_22665 [Salmonella enterica subsp. enterica]|nr:hypothetical protein KCP73_22665 [Salmonella enterica subsp. enterica]
MDEKKVRVGFRLVGVPLAMSLAGRHSGVTGNKTTLDGVGGPYEGRLKAMPSASGPERGLCRRTILAAHWMSVLVITCARRRSGEDFYHHGAMQGYR